MRYLATFFGMALAAAVLCGCGGGSGGASAGAPPQETGTVVGSVVDGTGQGISSAYLQVRNSNVDTYSQSDGYFRLDKVPVGTQLIDVTAAVGAVTKIVVVESNKTVNVTITISGTTGGSGGGSSVNTPPPPPF